MTAYLESRACISEDELYRYELTRRWGTANRRCVWIMLNPSTADGRIDDPTIRRCVGFSRAHGCAALTVVNLYALRCTRPIHLDDHPDPVGPENDDWIRRTLRRRDVCHVVCAWGAHDRGDGRADAVLAMTTGMPTWALGITAAGHPRHPLYVRGDTRPVPYPRRTAA